MQEFLETICIRDGLPQHLESHQRRVDATMQHFFPAHHHSWDLTKCIVVPSDYQGQGIIRCRIQYDAHHFSIHFYPYVPRMVESIKIVSVPSGFDYRFKYADRGVIEDLYTRWTDADEILMSRDGWIMDTSIANIAFQKNGRWFTPSMPLLAGTTWKRLVAAGTLIPRPINERDLKEFESFKIFNAMIDFESAPELPVTIIQ